jgi:hypothetical protein
MLMFFITLLFLQFSFFDLQYLLIRLPSLFAVQHHVPFTIYAIGYLGKRIVATVATKSHFFIYNTKLFPAEVALIDKPTNTVDAPAIK